MKNLLLFVFLVLGSSAAFAQKYQLTGKVTDADRNEGLPSATVQMGAVGTVTDFDGNYTLELANGTYQISYSYVGYATRTETVIINGANQTLNITMGAKNVLEEIKITADIAKARETPVAFSNISTLKLQEELAGQDIPLILNSTPGVYATQQGGGVGDSRVSIRGFSSRNVAVLLDGVPVNDMENGAVFWSNWFGLDNQTKTIQVQRGLGASRLAVPSVGGSINILTKGIDAKAATNLTTEIGAGDYLRTTVSANTGRLKGGWGISTAASYQNQQGIIDATKARGFFYYLRIDKQLGKHILSLSGFGAPQSHGTNSTKIGIGAVDSSFANTLFTKRALATQPYTMANFGNEYNSSWGYRKDGSPINTRINYYHKPQFTLRHTWQISDKLLLSNIAYTSLGSGGGTATGGNFTRLPNGLLNIAASETTNAAAAAANASAGAWIYSARNDHYWYGLLSNIEYKINKNFQFAGGLDLRDYQGNHYREVYDMLGGKQITANIPAAMTKNSFIHVGDRYQYDNTGYVRWGGAYGMVEYKNTKWSAFVNVSGAMTGYKLIDHLKPKVVKLADTTFYLGNYKQTTNTTNLRNGIIGFAPSVTHLGKTYTYNSPEAKEQTIDWLYQPSYTFKAGAAYNLNKHHNVFFNAGWLSRAMRFNNVIRQNTGNIQQVIGIANDYKNEEVRAIEVGYGYRSKVFSANINGYYTSWLNKPLETPIVVETEDGPQSINVNGIAALHKGIEFDGSINLTKTLNIEALASIGDWRWVSGAQYDYYNTVTKQNEIRSFDPTGVHVGDAAQTQYGAGIRWEPTKGLYFKARGTYFGNNYANFNPEDLTGANARRESWKMPDYWLLDFNAGYSFNIDKKRRAGIRLNVLNALNVLYLTDARNNDTSTFVVGTNNSTDFDARSASVSVGLPRRYTASFMVEF